MHFAKRFLHFRIPRVIRALARELHENGKMMNRSKVGILSALLSAAACSSQSVAPKSDGGPDESLDAMSRADSESRPDQSAGMGSDASGGADLDEGTGAAGDASVGAAGDEAGTAANTDAAAIDAEGGGPCSLAPVALGSAANFVVLAGSTVASTGPSALTGDMGVSPGTAITGFPPGTITGTEHAGDPTAAQGIADLGTAYLDAAGRTLCPISVAGNIGGQTLPPGLYNSTSTLAISSGDLTLDAQGNGDAVFIFQIASTLTTTSGRQVLLVNGAKSANVFWQVGASATLGTTSAFQGTINGRALAHIAAVTLDSNPIVNPAP
jgi:hypothetical protein